LGKPVARPRRPASPEQRLGAMVSPPSGSLGRWRSVRLAGRQLEHRDHSLPRDRRVTTAVVAPPPTGGCGVASVGVLGPRAACRLAARRSDGAGRAGARPTAGVAQPSARRPARHRRRSPSRLARGSVARDPLALATVLCLVLPGLRRDVGGRTPAPMRAERSSTTAAPTAASASATGRLTGTERNACTCASDEARGRGSVAGCAGMRRGPVISSERRRGLSHA
jgi:hypothetical protein